MIVETKEWTGVHPMQSPAAARAVHNLVRHDKYVVTSHLGNIIVMRRLGLFKIDRR